MPEHALVRDSQGYFHREAAHQDICAVLPHHGEAAESIFPEALADERLVYYPFLNNALGVIDALGAGGGIDETHAPARPPRHARPRAQAGRPLPAYAAGPPARRRDLAVQGEPAHAPARHGRAGRRHLDAVRLRDDPEPAGPRDRAGQGRGEPLPAARGLDDRAAGRPVVGRARRHPRLHGRAGAPRAVGGVRRRRPVRVRGDLPGRRGPTVQALRRAPRRPRLPHPGRRVRRRHGPARARWSASSWPATRAAPCASRTSATRGCSRSAVALGGEVQAELELPNKRAALVVWER